MKKQNTYIKQGTLYVFTVLLLASCQSVKQWQFTNAQSAVVELGAIVQREGALKNIVETKTLPQLQENLRVAVVKKTITKNALRQYNKILQQGGIDSVASTAVSSYTLLELELIDDVGYARTINNDQGARDYVKNAKKAGVITTISMLGTIDNDVLNAKDYFLSATDQGAYTIAYYNDQGELKTLSFADMTVFDFQVSYFCFGKDASGRIQVMDIVEEGKSCKRPLVAKAKKLQKTRRLIDY